MIMLTGAHHLVHLLSMDAGRPQTLNADYAWHLDNPTPPVAAPVRDAWLMRLLPSVVRTPLKARLAARAYDRTLIAMWDNSPHLLDDIGVMFAPAEGLADHLIPAPARVVNHVRAHGLIPVDQTPAVIPAQPPVALAPVALAPRSGAAPQRSNPDRPGTLPAGIAV